MKWQKEEESIPSRGPLSPLRPRASGFSELESSGQASPPHMNEYQHRTIMALLVIMASAIITMTTSLMAASPQLPTLLSFPQLPRREPPAPDASCHYPSVSLSSFVL